MTEIVLFIRYASGSEWPLAGEGWMCSGVPAPYQSGPTPEEHYYAQVLKGHIIQHGRQPRDLGDL